MRYFCDRNELYPFFTIEFVVQPGDRFYEGGLELTDEEYADYERVMREYQEWQDRIDLHVYGVQQPLEDIKISDDPVRTDG
jgi:hypothetical protein